VAVRRGVYTTAERWGLLDEYVGQPLLRVHAASATMRTPHVLSHDSAALAWGLQVLDGHEQPVHITRHGVLGGRHEHGVHHHKAPFSDEQVVRLGNHRVLDRARTVADIARWRGLEAGVVSADSALRSGVSRADLSAAVEPMTCWAGVTVCREVVAIADPGAENAAESVARVVVTQLGRGRPQAGVGLTDGRRTAWCDLLLGRHVIELDGRIKYRTRDRGGFADDPSAVAWEEKRRRDFLQSFRLGVSRLVWADLWGDARRAALARLEREVAETQRLFGTDTADLGPHLLAGPRVPRAS
jgi:hypothetical protein